MRKAVYSWKGNDLRVSYLLRKKHWEEIVDDIELEERTEVNLKEVALGGLRVQWKTNLYSFCLL